MGVLRSFGLGRERDGRDRSRAEDRDVNGARDMVRIVRLRRFLVGLLRVRGTGEGCRERGVEFDRHGGWDGVYGRSRRERNDEFV
jgi:hypothetical protein